MGNLLRSPHLCGTPALRLTALLHDYELQSLDHTTAAKDAEDDDDHKLPDDTAALDGAKYDENPPGLDDTAAPEGAEDDDTFITPLD